MYLSYKDHDWVVTRKEHDAAYSINGLCSERYLSHLQDFLLGMMAAFSLLEGRHINNFPLIELDKIDK